MNTATTEKKKMKKLTTAQAVALFQLSVAPRPTTYGDCIKTGIGWHSLVALGDKRLASFKIENGIESYSITPAGRQALSDGYYIQP